MSPAKKPVSKAKTKSSSGAQPFLDAVPVRSRYVLSRKNPDGSVAIIRLDNDQFFFTLDGISAEFWDSIDGKLTVSTIAGRIIKKHGLPEERFLKDIRRLLTDLRKEKLIGETDGKRGG